MARSADSESPLEALAAGEQTTKAFELLANETRLAILVALWERYDPYDETTAVRFSDLRTRVGTADSGRFNYHLERLDGHFVESTDEGYELTEAGLKIVRAVVAGTGIDDPTLEPSEVDSECSLCGAPVEVTYEDGWVYVLCTECNGLWSVDEDQATGYLGQFALDPAGLADRTPAEVYAAGWVRTFQRLYSMIEGVCPTCTGRVDRSIHYCDDHDPDGRCADCGRRARTIARLHCTVCKEWSRTTMGGIAKYHPAVVAFCYDRGLELQYGFNDVAHINDRLERTGSAVEKLSDDPLRVEVATKIDGDEIGLVLDSDLSVVEIRE